MDDLEACDRYFAKKAAQWVSVAGSVERHLRAIGTRGLVGELRADREFSVVCTYLHRLHDVQYVHDPRYTRFRDQVRHALEGRHRSLAGGRRAVATVVEASLLACGIQAVSDRMVRIVGALPR